MYNLYNVYIIYINMISNKFSPSLLLPQVMIQWGIAVLFALYFRYVCPDTSPCKGFYCNTQHHEQNPELAKVRVVEVDVAKGLVTVAPTKPA